MYFNIINESLSSNVFGDEYTKFLVLKAKIYLSEKKDAGSMNYEILHSASVI